MSKLSQDLPDERYRELRGAVFDSDGTRVMEALAGEVPVAVLQIAGDGLLVALDQHVEGTAELASAVSAALRERSNEGDTELADQLDAALGTAPTPMLRPLPVDLDDLSSALEGDPMLSGGRLDLRTGDVIEEPPMFRSSFEDEDEDLADPGSWLHIEFGGLTPGLWRLGGVPRHDRRRCDRRAPGRAAPRTRRVPALQGWPRRDRRAGTVPSLR